MYRCEDCGTPAPAGTLLGMELGCYECGGALERVEPAPEVMQPVLERPVRSTVPTTRVA